MSTVFIHIFNMSAAACWVILAVMLLRLLLKKAPRRLVCLLWVLAAVRLICPILPESPFALIPSAETLPARIEYAARPTIQSGIPVIDNAVNPALAASLSPAPEVSVNPMQLVLEIAVIVWLSGAAVMLGFALVSWLRLQKQVAASLTVSDRTYVCDEIKSPFIFGVLRPRIYLPSGMTADTEDCVTRHEQAHLDRRDHWWKPLGYLILCVYWFNPLVWAAYILLCRDIELACDEKVIRDMDTAGKAAYSQALLDCSLPRRAVTVCPLAFGEVGVKTRVKSVLSYKKPAFRLIATAVVLCAVVTVCFLTNPVSRIPDYNQLNGEPTVTADSSHFRFCVKGDLTAAVGEKAAPITVWVTNLGPTIRYRGIPQEFTPSIGLSGNGMDGVAYKCAYDGKPVRCVFRRNDSGPAESFYIFNDIKVPGRYDLTLSYGSESVTLPGVICVVGQE